MLRSTLNMLADLMFISIFWIYIFIPGDSLDNSVFFIYHFLLNIIKNVVGDANILKEKNAYHFGLVSSILENFQPIQSKHIYFNILYVKC